VNTKISMRARVKARQNAVQALYQHHMTGKGIREILKEFETNERQLKNVDKAFFKTLVTGIIELKSDLDKHIEAHLDRPLIELDPIELAVLHLGCYELEHQPEVPWKVVVNESVELAKLFGAEQSHKYINGVLDKMAQDLRTAEIKSSG